MHGTGRLAPVSRPQDPALDWRAALDSEEAQMKAYANAIDERLLGTLRRECLDHIIVVNESHLVRLLREFAAYYDRDRPSPKSGSASVANTEQY
jgi:hypothetical protein